MQSYIGDVKAWATANMLKLNDRTHPCHLKKIIISIAYLLQSLFAKLKFLSSRLKNFCLILDCHLAKNACLH